MMKSLLCLFLLFSLASCQEKNHNTKEQKTNKPILVDSSFTVLREQTAYDGQLRYKLHWNDIGGEHLFLISGKLLENEGEHQNGRLKIFAYQYINKDGDWQKEWKITDFVDGLGCDLTISLPKLFIRVVDPNGDGHFETAFIYTLDDRCDASMVKTKLLLHSMGEKLAIRGVSSQYLGPPEPVYNKYRKEEGLPPVSFKEFDPALEKVDATLKNYASELWDDFIEGEKKQE